MFNILTSHILGSIIKQKQRLFLLIYVQINVLKGEGTPMRFTEITDDLTGAADSGSYFTARGQQLKSVPQEKAV